MQPKWHIILFLVVALAALAAVSFGDEENAPGQEKNTSDESEVVSEPQSVPEEESVSFDSEGAPGLGEDMETMATPEDDLPTADALDANEGGGNPNPGSGIRSPNSKTYNELSAEWWKWSMSMPVTEHPLYDTADGSEGQSGTVWFIGSGVVNEMGPGGEYIVNVPNREITIPPGTKLFLPLFNVEGSTIEGVPEEVLEGYAQSFPQYVTEMSATVDGIDIDNLEEYGAPSDVFDIGPLPADNILGAEEGGTGMSAADGYYLLLPPLTPGRHMIHYASRLEIPGEDDEPDFVFIQDVTYTVIVKPEGKGK